MRALLLSLLTWLLISPAGAADVLAPREMTFTSSGDTLAAHVYGDPAAPNLCVLLAGGPGLEGEYLVPVAQRLAAGGTSVVLFDQRGTGDSHVAGADRAALTVAGAVADLDALRIALKRDRLTLVGHSWGGALALAYLSAEPQHVARIVLLDSDGPDATFQHAFGLALNARLTPAQRGRVDTATSVEARYEALLPAYFIDPRTAVPFAASIAARPMFDAESGLALWNDVTQHYAVSDRLRTMTLPPTTVVYGDEDPLRVAEPSLRLALPTAHFVDVPHSAHFPWIENQRAFETILHDALAATDTTSASR